MALFPEDPIAGQEVYDPVSDRWFRFNDNNYWELLDATKYLVRGEAGPRGPQGRTGDTGDDGATGLKGDTGAVGAQGNSGPQGEIGERGIMGPPGEPGAAMAESIFDAPSGGPRGKLYITDWNELYITTRPL